MVQTATNTFYNREQEREANAQKGEKRKEKRHAYVLATLQRSPMANTESLKDKANAQSVDKRDIGPKTVQTMTSLQNSLPQMPSIGTLGGTLPWGPKSLKVKHQAFPHDGSTGMKEAAGSSQPACHR